MKSLSGLEPKKVFEYFERLSSVPHGSGNTDAISELCVEMAKELGLYCRREPCNNVIIRKGGSAGYESSEPIILQGHMDMVCVKTDDCEKDLTREGPDLMTDGEWVWADRTSLGGDDCIALAVIFAILADDSLPHPPIEALFTVDEETGMDGAFNADLSDFKGRRLLNLDSEEEGVFTVSCAGGINADCYLPCSLTALTDEKPYRIRLGGLIGGHSGTEIDKGRANANNLMARVLYTAAEQFPGLRIADIRGGRFHNVICPLNEALVAVSAEKAEAFKMFIRGFGAVLGNEYAGCDDGLMLSCEPARFDRAADVAATSRMLHALLVLPQGVLAMSADIPGLVQTSANLGLIGMEDDGLHFSVSVRSGLASQKQMTAQRIRAITELTGGVCELRGAYPGWQYKRDSVLRDTVTEVCRRLTGKEGRVAAVHAGLECGILAEKLPGLDAVSIGPDILDIHSVNERLNVASVQRLYALVCETLRMCK